MLQWADTFNRYGTTIALMLNGLYAEVNNCTLPADIDPASSQNVLKNTPTNSTDIAYRYAFPGGAKSTMGFSTLFWFATLPPNGAYPPGWELRDANNIAQIAIVVNTTGTISIKRGAFDTGTVLATTTVPVVTANAYAHLEAKVFISDTVGTVEVRINGVSQLAISGVDTQATALSTIAQLTYCCHYTGSVVSYHKGLIVWDTTGTYNKDFMGTVLVIDRDAVSDVALTWTPSTGATGYQILDNNPPLDDAAYISAATALANTFGIQDLPADVTSVRGLVLINRSRKIDAGDGNAQQGIISGASTGLGADRPITTAYTYWPDVIEVDPATGLPFTPSAFNLANLKLARTV